MVTAFEGVDVGYILQYLYAFVTVTSLFVLFLYLKKNTSLKKSLCAWFTFSFLYNFFSLSWLYAAYPLSWIPKEGQLLLITFVLIAMSLVAAVPFLWCGFVHGKLYKQRYISLYLALSVFSADMMRSLFLSFLFFKQGSVPFGFHWSAGTLGNALSVTPLVSLSLYGGVFFLSSLLVFTVHGLLHKTKKGLRASLTFLLLLLLVTYALPVHTPKKGTSIGLVTLTREEGAPAVYDNAFFKGQAKTVTTLTENTSFDILVLPEDTRFMSHAEKKGLLSLQERGTSVVVDGDTFLQKGKPSNVSFVHTLNTNGTEGRGKWFLFPFNEYLPSLFTPLANKALGEEGLIAYEKKHTYTSDESPTSFETPFGSIGTLVCSEMFSHSSVQSLSFQRPSVIVLQSDLSVFHKNPWLFMQYHLIAKTIAAQSRTLLVVSSVDAPALVISPYGKSLFVGPLKNTLHTFSVDR